MNSGLIRSFSIGSVFLLGMLMSADASAQDKRLWGNLTPGAHAVGFQTFYALDHAREYDAPFQAKEGVPKTKSPRPILINIWYPAKPSDRPRMLYREYLDVPSADPRIALFAKRLMAYARQTIAEEVLEERPAVLDSVETKAIETMMATPTFATRDAAIAEGEGRFPVVINHAGLGGTYEDNSVFFEFLASHGYVVVTSAFMAESSACLNVDWDLDRSIKDMEFIVRLLVDRPGVDISRLGAMGHSYGAQAVLAWRSENNSPVDAVVSLDSTIEYNKLATDAEKLKARVDRAENMAAPILMFASKDSEANFQQWEFLKYTRRYEAQVEHLEHNDYVSQGTARGDYLPGRRFPAETQALVRKSYEEVCLLTKTFLDAHVKHDPAALARLDRRSKSKETGSLVVKHHEPEPLPPTAGQLVRLILEGSPESTRAMLKSLGTKLSLETFADAGFGLRQVGRMRESLALLRFDCEIRPNEWAAFYQLGFGLEEAADKPAALEAFRKALELAEGSQEGQEVKASDRSRKRIRSKILELAPKP